jgi:integrase
MPTGIRARHARTCASRSGGRCRCQPSWEAWAWSSRDQRKLSKTFPTLTEARAWRGAATKAVSDGTLRAPSNVTLREAADKWLRGAEDGTIRTRSGDPYKPSAIRSYRSALDLYVLDDLGGAKLTKVSRRDVQALAERLQRRGLDPSTIRNAVMPLRAIYRRAVANGDVAVNPTTGLELPAVRGRRDRIASPEEAAALLGALPEEDRALWATALFAGLRRGELMALDWQHVDLAKGVIRVERQYDEKARVFTDPKSRAGRRSVPLPAVLRDYLVEHKLRTGRDLGLVFGATPDRPFTPSNVGRRAKTAWKRENDRRAVEEPERERLAPISLHEARHTFASVLIDAGVNAKAISTYMGHSSIQITYDLYGHLMPGNEEEAVARIDAYLTRSAQANAQTPTAEGEGCAPVAPQRAPVSSGLERS